VLSSSKVALSNTIQFKKIHKVWELNERGSLSSMDAVTKCAWLRKARLSVRLSTKNMIKLHGLSDSASLSHRHLSKRMSVHPPKMKSLSVVGAHSEFFRERLYSMSTDELA